MWLFRRIDKTEPVNGSWKGPSPCEDGMARLSSYELLS